jgi:hypothetical protein
VGLFAFREESRGWAPVRIRHPRGEKRAEKRLCKPVGQEQSHEKGPRWSWARNQKGNQLKQMNKPFCWFGAMFLLISTGTSAGQNWQIHEWGTFTSLQDESGRTIGGINTDDEPVPPFVHRLVDLLVFPSSDVPPAYCQGAPACHPDVTMRLETPVIYFHPPQGATPFQSATVKVRFRGGWLTEYYPDAEAYAFGATNRFRQFPHLYSSSEGSLEWDHLQIGGDWPLTNTSAHVWVSPRAVQAALVHAANDESERFLFYRGVGHINAPLKISRDTNTDELLFRSQLEEMPDEKPLAINSMWLVDIRPDRRVGFRSLPPLLLNHNAHKILTHAPAAFAPDELSHGNLAKLKAALQASLVSEGLFPDEAQALLNTWDLSYFKSPGLRVFFIVPRAWTDFYLPLDISLPAEIHRVMVGRIELVTPWERDGLRELAGFSPATIHDQALQMATDFHRSKAPNGDEFSQLYEGQKHLSAYLPVPKTYQTYLDLGRFRNALLLDEATRTPGLTNFMANYGIRAYQPVDIK